MAITPYPSNLIIFDIDERVLDKDMKLALKRSWTHISDMLVRSHPAPEDGSEPCNFVHVMVKYGTRHYLEAGNEEADRYWNERMEQHLLSTMRKLGNNTIAFNRYQRNTGAPEIEFDHVEFSLESGALTMEFLLDSNGSLPIECSKIATEIRTKLGEGVLGDPERVRVPSHRSYAAQALAAAKIKAEQEAREAAEREALEAQEAELREQAELEAEEQFMESPELSAELERAEEEEHEKTEMSPLEVTPLTEEEWEALYGVQDADFEVAYDTWELQYADGSSKEFDPATGEFIEVDDSAAEGSEGSEEPEGDSDASESDEADDDLAASAEVTA